MKTVNGDIGNDGFESVQDNLPCTGVAEWVLGRYEAFLGRDEPANHR